MSKLIYAVIMILATPVAANANITVYRFQAVIDGTGITLDATDIAVENGVIVAVGKQLDQTADSTLVVMSGLTALPGLIDAHTHITYGLPGAPKGDAWAELGKALRAERLEAAKVNAMKTLGAGVTTVRDLNADQGIDYEIRDAINAGMLTGPRIFTSGPGIHPRNDPSPEGTDNASPAFLKMAVEKRIADGADWIKIFGTSGSASDLTSRAYYSAAAIKAAVDAATSAGKRITIHSYGIEAVDAALEAGVTSLDHPVGLTQAHLRTMKANGTIYIPTIDHNRYYAQHGAEYGYDQKTKDNLHMFVGRNLETVRSAHAAGVTIAMGSDAVMTGFGENTCELRAFVAAGMTPAQALETATLNSAKLLGKDDELGRLQPGYLADITAVNGNPLEDINVVISNVTAVIKDGILVVDHRETSTNINSPDCGQLY